MRQGQGKNVQQTKKRNMEIINNIKQTLSKPTIVEAQRTLKILQKMIDRIGLFLYLDSEFIMKFNEINNPQKLKLNKTLIQELSPKILDLVVKEAKMEAEFRSFNTVQQQLKEGEVVEEEKLQEFERVKKDTAYTFKSLVRALEGSSKDVQILKTLKMNAVPNTEASNIHEALSNYKIIMQKTLATAAQEEQSHTRLIEELQLKISSLEKTKANCQKDLLKLREDRAKHAEQKKQQMDKLKSQIREVKNNKDREMEEIAKKTKDLSENLHKQNKKEQDSLKTLITQEKTKLTKLREENGKAENKSKGDKHTNQTHFMEMITQYDIDMSKLSGTKRNAEKQLKRVSDELNNLKRHFLEIEEERKREEALLEADRLRKHRWELMEKKKAEAATRIKEAYRLWKKKNKKKKKRR